MRLPFFPIPAEGETVFSVVGRCAERLGISNKQLMTILTGQSHVTTLFSALPGYLERIASAMPDGHPWQDVTVIINKHTALPYFVYFHHKDIKLLNLRLLATREGSLPVILKMGLTMYRTPASPKNPRFCLKCSIEQTTKYGFSYFQVAHQLPSVSVCWKHDEVLYDGCSHCGQYPLNGKKLTMPGQCLCGSFEPTSVSSHSVSTASNWLARNSAFLLTSSQPIVDPIENLRKGILRSGLGRGSCVDHIQLAEAIQDQLGRNFLRSINYLASEGGTPSAWLRRYLSNGKAGRQTSTIAGLLISAAAFDSIQDFENNKPIARKTIKRTQTTAYEHLPEKWKMDLHKDLRDSGFRISSCAAALNKTPWEIAVAARDQNIPVPLSSRNIERIGIARLTQIKKQLVNSVPKKQIMDEADIGEWTLLLIEISDPNLRQTRKNSRENSLLQKHRRVVTDLLKKRSDITRCDIMRQFPGAYDFLVNRDKKWLQETLPRSNKKQTSSRKALKNWKIIDKELSVAINETATQLLADNAKPKRVTASALLARHGALQRYTNKPERYPITRKMLATVVESPEQHLFRKLNWGIKQLILAKQEISIESLRRKCGIQTPKLHRHLDEIRKLILDLGGHISKKSKLSE